MTHKSPTSKVLTLVFTDLADSTALKSRHGDDAMDELLTRHREHVARLADECQGRIIDWAGDGCFLTFDTSSAAVMFSLRLQQAHSDEADLPGVRIGVHLGEVTEKSGPDGATQVKGLAVDVAARVSSLSKPGQVLMSSAVYNSAKQRMGVDSIGQPILWQLHGLYDLKGFDHPLEIAEAGFEGFAPLEAPGAGEKASPTGPSSRETTLKQPKTPSRSYVIPVLGLAIVVLIAALSYVLGSRGNAPDEPVPTDAPITSLAVLPLDNLMNDPEQDYFADGMTEAITAELAKIKSLKVISRTSVMRFKGTQMSMPDIAKELNVDGLIEGSVLRDDDEVRITVQLIDGRSDTHIWAESYTNTMTSVINLQSEVALAIADAVGAELTPDEQNRIAKDVRVNSEAYDAYLKAWNLIPQSTEESLTRALAYLKRAQELDPNMAEAWAAEARAHWVFAISLNSPIAEQIEKVRLAASRALALDDTQFYGHVGMGSYAQVHDRDWETAVRHFERASELNPNEPLAVFYLGLIQTTLGNWRQSKALAEEVVRLSPSASYERSLASILFFSSNESARAFEVSKDIDVIELPRVQWQQANIYLSVGQAERALVNARAVNERGQEAEALAQAGRSSEALQLIDAIKAANETGNRMRARYTEIAAAYIWMNDLDSAFDYLERAYQSFSNWTPLMLRRPYLDICINDPRWIAFRQDPRYRDLVERMKLPPLPPEHPGYAEEQAWHARKATAQAANAPIEKIAVLPFDNISGDPDQEYFVDGMTESLTAELAKIKSLKVISRTSAMRYKNTDKTTAQIANELGVHAFVEGSVQRADNDIRITAQLIDARTDEHLWADSFDAVAENVLKLQGEIALTIADEIGATLTTEERTTLSSEPTVVPAAHDAYMRGRHFWNRRTQEGFERAIEYFQQAVLLQPNHAPAYAGLSESYTLMGEFRYRTKDDMDPLARAAAQRALDINEQSAEANASMCIYQLLYAFDALEAERYGRRAVELNPSYATAQQFHGDALMALWRIDEAIESLKRAVELDPFSLIINTHFGMMLHMGRRNDEAEAQYRRALELDPAFSQATSNLSRLLASIGRLNEALEHIENTRDWTEDQRNGHRALAYVIAGEEDQARALLDTLIKEDTDAWTISAVYAVLGDLDESFKWFDRSLDKRESGAVMMVSDIWDGIRDDPRFNLIRQRLNIPIPAEETN